MRFHDVPHGSTNLSKGISGEEKVEGGRKRGGVLWVGGTRECSGKLRGPEL